VQVLTVDVDGYLLRARCSGLLSGHSSPQAAIGTIAGPLAYSLEEVAANP